MLAELLFKKLWERELFPNLNQSLLDDYVEKKYEKLQEEIFEVIKGNVKTTILCKFNQEGYLVSHTTLSKQIRDSDIMRSLKTDLHEALDKEDYVKAKEVQDKINKIRNLEEQKPTI